MRSMYLNPGQGLGNFHPNLLKTLSKLTCRFTGLSIFMKSIASSTGTHNFLRWVMPAEVLAASIFNGTSEV